MGNRWTRDATRDTADLASRQDLADYLTTQEEAVLTREALLREEDLMDASEEEEAEYIEWHGILTGAIVVGYVIA